MGDQQQRENSVLLSLKELRRMEDNRLQEEQNEIAAKAEAERQTREAGERRAREEAERQRQEAEDRVRREEEGRVAREREEQLRLQEAERRARVEGEMRLQEERIRLEVQHRKRTSPLKAILGVSVVLVLVGGGAIYKLDMDNQAKLQAQRADQLRLQQEEQRRAEEEKRKLETRLADLEQKLTIAKTEEERQRLKAEIARATIRQGMPSRPMRDGRPEVTPIQPKAPTIKDRKKVSDDPLDGLKL
jgi:hypothetical protein